MTSWTDETTENVEEQFDNPVTINYKLADAEEKKKIDEIREACKSELDSLRVKPLDVVGDIRLLRFLRNNDGNVKNTIKSVKKFVKARKAKDGFIEKAREHVEHWTPEDCQEYFKKRTSPYYVVLPYGGLTKEGDILSFAILQNYNAKDVVSQKPIDRPIDYEFWYMCLVMEWRFMYLDKLSRERNRLCYCIEARDLKGTKLSVKDLTSKEARVFQDMFNERMNDLWPENHSVAVIVNGGKILKAILTVAKAFMSKRHQQKILAIGKMDKEENQAKLYKVIQKDLCPVQWKGSNKYIEDCLKVYQTEWTKETIAEQWPKSTTYDLWTDEKINWKTCPPLEYSQKVEKDTTFKYCIEQGAKEYKVCK